MGMNHYATMKMMNFKFDNMYIEWMTWSRKTYCVGQTDEWYANLLGRSAFELMGVIDNESKTCK